MTVQPGSKRVLRSVNGQQLLQGAGLVEWIQILPMDVGDKGGLQLRSYITTHTTGLPISASTGYRAPGARRPAARAVGGSEAPVGAGAAQRGRRGAVRGRCTCWSIKRFGPLSERESYWDNL